MEGYSARVLESSRDLTAKERVSLKTFDGAIALDTATEDGCRVVIDPAMWAVVEVHNERTREGSKDYKKYVIVDKSGERYVTSSQSLWSAFMDIWSDMKDEAEEWSVEVYKRPSKNYSGKDFITCSIL